MLAVDKISFDACSLGVAAVGVAGRMQSASETHQIQPVVHTHIYTEHSASAALALVQLSEYPLFHTDDNICCQYSHIAITIVNYWEYSLSH